MLCYTILTSMLIFGRFVQRLVIFRKIVKLNSAKYQVIVFVFVKRENKFRENAQISELRN